MGEQRDEFRKTGVTSTFLFLPNFNNDIKCYDVLFLGPRLLPSTKRVIGVGMPRRY